MRIQFNVSAGLLVVALGAIITFRFVDQSRLQHKYLAAFAKSLVGKDQRVISSCSYRNETGKQRFVFVCAERGTRGNIGYHSIIVTDASLVPIAWQAYAYDCQFKGIRANKEREIVVERRLFGKSHTLKYEVASGELRLSGSKDGTARFVMDRGGTQFITDDIDYMIYQRLGDRSNGARVGRWGNK